MVNLYQRGVTLWHDYLLLAASAVDMMPSISSSVALFYSKLRRQTVISRLYPTSRSHDSPLIKTSLHRNLTTAIVFDELVVKGEQAHQRH